MDAENPIATSVSPALEASPAQLEPAHKVMKMDQEATTRSTQATTNTPGMEGEGKNLPIATSEEGKRKTATNYEPPTLMEIVRKLRKDSGAYGFIPLSSGKYLGDVWWEPTACEVNETRKANGVPWLLMSVKIFIDVAGLTVDIDNAEMNVKFRTSPDDLLKVCYLKDRLMRDLHSERTQFTYDEWYRVMAQKLRMEDCASDAEFAKKVFDHVLALAITRLPGNFHIFMQKKGHTAIKGLDAMSTSVNRNSILCEASGKVEFKYEFRTRFFVVCDEVTLRKKESDESQVPESLPLTF